MSIKNTRLAAFKLVIIAAFTGVFAVQFFVGNTMPAEASASGPSPSYTNAPGEGNCTACHLLAPVNTGTGSVAISGVPANYLPGQEVPITVTTTQSDGVVYGFQLTALDHSGANAGSFTLPSQNPMQLQFMEGPIGNDLRRYVEHTAQGIIPTEFGSKSWTFTWTAPEQRIGKIGFYAAGNGANGDGHNSGDYIYTTSTASLSGSAISNFDGDTASDIGVYRPSTGNWYSYNISTGAVQTALFGLAEDKIAPGDYDGDGTTDYAVFRPSSGTWYIQRSSLGFTGVQFGSDGDLPVAGDYDGDGMTDIAVFRPSNGYWYIMQSTAGFTAAGFGLDGDKPVPGDFDADGKTDFAVFRPSTGTWYLQQSTAGFAGMQFGSPEDRPVQSDFDGDGKTDIAVFRPSTGIWYLLRSTDGFLGVNFGLSEDIPAPADYDGDGKTDIAVFRPSNGTWYLTRSSDDSFYAAQFGLDGDVPVAAGYLAW